MEAAERHSGKDEQEQQQPMFVDSSMLETDIQMLENEIMTPSPLKTALHESLNLNFQTPAGKNNNAEEDSATIISVRTPADNLLEKFQSLNDSWVDVKTRSASTKKRVMTTPSMEDLLSSPVPNFASALNDYSTVDRDDENDDDVSSIGSSTISTISSQESVFDRLHNHGKNQQRRRRSQKPSDSFISPKGNISTNEFNTPSCSTSSSVSSSNSRSRKSASKQQTKKIRNRVIPASASKSSASKSKNRSDSKVSPTSSQDSVFDRLYRNQKRTETLWQKPPAPQLVTRSSDRKKSGTRRKSGGRPSKIPAPSTPQTASKPQLKKKRISDSPATVPKSQGLPSEVIEGNSIEPLLEATSAASDLTEGAAAASPLAEDSTTDSTVVRSSAALALDEISTASEKENKSRPRTVPATREQPTALKNANWSTTSIDEDLAELAAIQRDLDQQQQHLAPTPRKTNVPFDKLYGKASSIEPKQLYSNPSAATGKSLLDDDLDNLLKPPQVSRSRAPSVASTATHTHVEDDDTTSRASSGFFTLDHPQRALTLQPLVYSGHSKATGKESVPSARKGTEQAATTIQSWWKSCLAKVSLAGLVIEHRNMAFPSALDTSPMVLLRIINSTRPHILGTQQHGTVLAAQSPQISLEIRLATPSFSILRRQLSNGMLLRSALASARLEYEGIVFVEASQMIQSWWRRTKKRDKQSATIPSSVHKVTGGVREKELSFYLEDATGGLLEEELLHTPSKDLSRQDALDRSSTDPQKTPICKELSLLGDLGESDEELLVTPSKSLVPRTSEVDGGRELFPTPTSGDLADWHVYEEDSVGGYFDPVPVESPVRTRKYRAEQDGDCGERQEAASVIQRTVRMSTLTTAIVQSTPTRDHMRQTLSSPNFPRWQKDDPWMFKEPSDGFQQWVGSTDLIERNASRLATHNIVRAYLNGLRKYRRTKKAILIQSTLRRFQCARKYQEKRWAILAIQHGWKACKYRRMLRSKATKIKAAYKMKVMKTKFQTIRFAAILLQNQWRCHHSTQEYSKAQFLASWLQRTCVRAREHRQRYVALRSATISLQYRFRLYSTKKRYKLEMAKATRIQSVWRTSFAKRERLLSIYYACKIQSLVRSHFASGDYLKLRSSSITVQSAWRMHRALRTYQLQRSGVVKVQALSRRCLAVRWYMHQHESVIRVQSLSRMHHCIRLKRKNLQAAVVIQREARRFLAEGAFITFWKATLMIQSQQRRHAAQNSFFKTKAAVVRLQSVGRAHICQRSFEENRDAALKIQCLGRCYNQRCLYLADRDDITLVQSIFRQWLAQNNFRKSRAAAVYCQKTIRRHFSSTSFAKTKTACTNIQKAYRRFQAIRSWEIAMKSIIHIQSFLRMFHTRDAWNIAMLSVRTLQRVFRGYQQRSKLNIQQHATVKIQSIVRCSIDQAQYLGQRKASIVIQSIARRNAAIHRLNEAKYAAIMMQKAIRYLQHRSTYLRMLSSASGIQATARGFIERLRYNRTRNEILAVQRIWRGAIARVRASSHYRAALLIQRCWRGKASRILAKQRTDCIIARQRYSRGYVARRQHERLRHSRLLLAQSSWRAAVWRRRFVARKKSVLNMQTMIRGYLVRKEAISRMDSAVVIQAHWRMTHSREVYSRTRVSAVMMQGLVRGMCVRSTIARLHVLATRVQRHWRGHVGRLYCNELVETRNAKIAAARLSIQSIWRMYVARVQFRQVKNATTSIQKNWRAFSARENFALVRFSCIFIQAIARGAVVRTRQKLCHECSLEIQRSWRGYLGATRFQLLFEEDRLAKIEKAEGMRRVELMGLAICAYQGLACIAVVVQKDFARQQHAHTHNACTMIQSAARGMLVRTQISNRPSPEIVFSNRGLREQSESAIKIQSIYRSRVAKKAHHAKLQSAIFIQKQWRSLQACQHYVTSLASSVMIQSAFRGSHTRNEVRAWRQSAICVQKTWRGFAGAQKLNTLRAATIGQAVIMVQSKWRMYKAAKRYQTVCLGVLHLQKFWRASLLRSRFELAHSACVMIQRSVRGSLVRWKVKTWNISAICIQKTWRRYIGANKINSLSEGALMKQSLAATKIQSISRLQVARKSSHARLISLVAIQKHWRSAQAREHYEMCRASSVIIQSIARGSLVRGEILFLNEAVVRVQKHWRSAMARERYELCRTACVIMQSIIRESLVRKKIEVWNESAASCQKIWRGYCSAKKALSLAKHASIERMNAATRMQSPPCTPVAKRAHHSELELPIVYQRPDDDRSENCPVASISAIEVVHDLLNRSATPIQKIWRGASLRVSLENSRVLESSAATLIQASFRSHRARQLYHTTLMMQSVSATLLQSNVRGMFTRDILAERGDAAVSIQRFWRNRSLRLALLQLSMDERLTQELENSYRTQAAAVLQSFARRQIAQESFWAIRNCIIVVQSLARGRRLRMQLNDSARAAITIQKQLRGAATRSHMRGLHNAARIIQACFRMFLVSSSFWFLRLPRASREMLNSAARKIQVAFFLFKMRLAILSMQSSAIILKRCIRGQLVRSAAKFALHHVNSAFHNPMILSFARVVAGNDPDYVPTYVAWKRAVSQAEISSTIVIQSAARRFLIRARIAREFNVSFDSHLLLDQTLIEEEDSSALAIQWAFKGWRSRRAHSLLLENDSQERNQAAIQLQRMARGRKSRILAKAYNTKTKQMSRDVTAIVLAAVQRSSKERVRQLLGTQSSSSSISSSLQCIADRTKVAQSEAATLASSALPVYAISVLNNLEAPNDQPSNLQQRNKITPIGVAINTSLKAQFAPKGPSTPVRCNKTQTVKKSVQRSAFANKKTSHVLPRARQKCDNSQPAQLKPQTKPVFHGMGAFDLLKLGRENMKKTQAETSSMKHPTAQRPKTNVALVKTTQAPKSPPKKVDAGNNTLFGDPNNMPSPIKKQADWDWADEW